MIRKSKKYVRPRKPFESQRIKDENVLVKKYGLKNKKEIWKTLAKVDYLRGRAKALAKSPLAEQEVLFKKLRELGLKIDSIAEVLDLKVEHLLERRLSTVVAKKGIAHTTKQARQMIAHKKIMINKRAINVPSYLVRLDEEDKIELKQKKKHHAEKHKKEPEMKEPEKTKEESK
jgi:small subunit ribosomal protein S4